MRHVDVVIVGGGIAGITLAWKLVEAGVEILVVDRPAPHSASRVSAGLMTPVTGKKFATSPDWQDDWSEAKEFYRRIEDLTDSSLFHDRQMVRLFRSREEQEFFHQRDNPEHESLITSVFTRSPQMPEAAQFGGFEMSGGQLDVRTYLEVSKRHFESQGRYLSQVVHGIDNVHGRDAGLGIPELNLTAGKVIFCSGYSELNETYFPQVRFNPAKGEILTVRFENYDLANVIHRGIWVAPHEDHHKVGGTYDWNDLSAEPTIDARQSLQRQLGEFLSARYEIINHQAAIRPTMHDFRPVLGWHPEHSCLGILNGLGSKGSLTAPRLSRLMTEHLINSHPIPPELSVQRWFR